MLITTKGRYALRMMVYLGQSEPGVPVSLTEISTDEEISVKYLEQFAHALLKADIIKSVRGQRGGYVLARSARDITVGEILRAVEGDIAPVPCVGQEDAHCPRARVCTTLDFWHGLDAVINDYVDKYTLDALCE